MMRRVVLLVLLVLFAGCTPPQPPVQPKQAERPVSPERIEPKAAPAFTDDLPAEGLKHAIQQSLSYYGRVPGDRLFSFGDRRISAKLLKESMDTFLMLMDSGRLDPASLSEFFDIYRVPCGNEGEACLVTGYFEPVLDGRLEPAGEFRWPLYGMPPDLVTVDLEAFDPKKFPGEHLTGRIEKGRVVPYYTRAEIDGRSKLRSSGCELVWLKDPVDAFFLHVQGSGLIKLGAGAERRIGYAGANGRPYRSIGKFFLDRNIFSRDEVSLRAIRDYLRAHPEERDAIMWENESYVFFKWVKEGPMGSLDARLTEGRSIATDAKYHPRGALAFLATEKPRLDEAGYVLGWEPLTRWVLNQDAGGAIKGPCRVDLFCGTGDDAEAAASPMKQPGQLYYLIRKGGLEQ